MQGCFDIPLLHRDMRTVVLGYGGAASRTGTAVSGTALSVHNFVSGVGLRKCVSGNEPARASM